VIQRSVLGRHATRRMIVAGGLAMAAGGGAVGASPQAVAGQPRLRVIATMTTPNPGAGPFPGPRIAQAITRLAWSPDGSVLGIAPDGGLAGYLWRPGEGSTPFAAFPRRATNDLIAFLDGGALVVSAAHVDWSGTGPLPLLTVFDARSGDPLRTIYSWLPPGSGPVNDLSTVSAAARLAVVCAREGYLTLLDTNNWLPTVTNQINRVSISTICLAEDGKQLAVGGIDFHDPAESRPWRSVRRAMFEVYNVDASSLTRRGRVVLEKPTDAVRALAFSPDGRDLAVAGETSTDSATDPDRRAEDIDRVHLFDPEGLSRRRTLRWPRTDIERVAFSRDGRFLSTLQFRLLTIVDMHTGAMLQLPIGVNLGGMAWHPSPGRPVLAYASDDKIHVVEVDA